MSRSQRGFTLLEILVVTGILAILTALLMPRLNSQKQAQAKGFIRDFAVLSRSIRNQAKLENATYRLAIKMNPQDGEKRVDSFWVESAGGMILGDQREDELKKEEKQDKDKPSPSLFQKNTKITKHFKQLPDGLIFSKVELASAKQPFTEGIVYLYYLPQGYIEENVIQLSYGENIKWTLAIQPLTGKVDVAGEHIDLAKLRGE